MAVGLLDEYTKLKRKLKYVRIRRAMINDLWELDRPCR